MSRVFYLAVLFYSSLMALEFHTYKEALALQKKSGKTIMLDVIRTDCRYCIKMDKEVFADKQMSQYLSEKFIPAKINLDHEKLPLGIKTHFTPSFFFINKEQEIIKTIPGSWSSEDFKELTKNIK